MKFSRSLGVFLILVLFQVMWTHDGMGNTEINFGPTLFESDFSNDDAGALPGGWQVTNSDGEIGLAQVVAAPELGSGKALHVKAFPRSGDMSKVSLYSTKWQNAGDVRIVAIDYKIKWVSGNAGLYTYFNDTAHRMILLPQGGNLIWHVSNNATTLGLLNHGWNHVRVVADLDRATADVFLNSMTRPVARDLQFQRPIDSWKDMRIILTHETHKSDVREAYYAEFKVRAVTEYSGGDPLDPNDVSVMHWDPEPIGGKYPPRLELDTPDGKAWKAHLRPTDEAKMVLETSPLSIPFYQAIPVGQGELFPSQPDLFMNGLRSKDGKPIPAVVSTSALWPDGSVRWLAIDGVWPADFPLEDLEQGVEVSVPTSGPCRCEMPMKGPVASLGIRNGEVHLFNAQGETVAALLPAASYIEIANPKVILPDSMPDDERQYEWAQELGNLNSNSPPKPLQLRIRDHALEQVNSVFTEYRLRGDGGAGIPGENLEWQLRVRVYRQAPIVRIQMTWAIHWDPNQYALTGAEWKAQFDTPFNEVTHLSLESPLSLADGAIQVTSDPTGSGLMRHSDAQVAMTQWPQPEWGVAVATSNDWSVGVAVPNFNRLGPNRLGIEQQSITFASWDRHSGYGLDLRQTAEPHEFGRDSGDSQSSAAGLARTFEASLVWDHAGEVSNVQEAALLEARRDNLWFPSRDDLIATGAIGPWSDYVFEYNQRYFENVNAHIHFMIKSRDRWRWNGWVNFGDVRTNFSRGSNPDRGLHPGRWALYGRYGWRNGSTEPYHGMWLVGLGLEDREVLLAAYDYALHVADVDVVHERFFGGKTSASGGMHRRNKDHWSGSVQMQYTPSHGLYLTQWLTGNMRLTDTLEEVRDYAARQKGSGSAYAASAWINRYMETHDPADLAQARLLLDESAAVWERAGPPLEEHRWGDLDPDIELKGLNALYKNNFRLPTNGIPVLIEFYEATRDPLYLDTILTIMQAHGVPSSINRSLGNYFGISYLLAQGYTEEQVGQQLVDRAKEHVRMIISQSRDIDPAEWTYENLADFVTLTETTGIGWQATYAPTVVRSLGNHPVQIEAVSPKAGATVKGTLPLQLELKDSSVASKLKEIIVKLNGNVIYQGSSLPDPSVDTINTSILSDGSHTLSWTVVLTDYGTFQDRVTFNVQNKWVLVQNMVPPALGGWFGIVDFLQTYCRSEGWTHETGDSDLFYGDPQRLVRATEATEFLIWKTPGLQSVDATLFVRPGISWKGGIELALSSDGQEWWSAEYSAVEEPSEADWVRVNINLDLNDEADWFRLTIFEEIPRDSVQIGDVVLTGLRDGV